MHMMGVVGECGEVAGLGINGDESWEALWPVFKIEVFNALQT